tara:strand:- start:157 stop:303 length:147 start_codon:yes stop_codon:yes gene_type:complete
MVVVHFGAVAVEEPHTTMAHRLEKRMALAVVVQTHYQIPMVPLVKVAL